ncbi:MAG: cytidylate kinase [Candidatus Omnitrophica bacterium CG1_02_49_10]|nr:MAG: cytidylate kinase [Candidatus Omnitrophica bacterium CG1_02_49_10]
MRDKPIIAIDGPAGSGKSTVSRLFAKKLGFLYLDTGAMYRALTLKAVERGLDLEDEGALIELSASTDIRVYQDKDYNVRVELDSRDVSAEIREPDITNKVSFVAGVKGVRDNLVGLQQKIGRNGAAVLEGRDIGTVVFPDAEYKFYLDADFIERVKRRHKELLASGTDISREDIEKDVRTRDEKDLKRKHSPLKKADDSIYIDTTGLSVDEVVDKLASYISR